MIKKNIQYIVAKTKLEAQTKEALNTMDEAKQSVSNEDPNQKWYLFAKRFNQIKNQYDYIVVSYYDIISPIGDFANSMQWFDFQNYVDNEKAKIKFKSLKV